MPHIAFRIFRARAAFALFATLGAAAPFAPISTLRAAPAEKSPDAIRPTLSSDLAEHIPTLSKLLDAADFPALLSFLDQTILPATKPNTFDQALFLQIRGQALLNLKRPLDAIAPLEESLRLASGKNWFSPATRAQIHQTLSQLYYQKYAELPSSAAPANAAHRAALDSALQHADLWLALAGTRPNPDIYYYTATLNYAVGTLDPAKIEQAALKVTLAAAAESLARRTAAHEASLVLAAAALQQLGDNLAVAEHLELLLAANPRNPQYWQQLFAIYIGLATEAKLPSESRHWQARALLTQQRARAIAPKGNSAAAASAPKTSVGYLDAPQDYLNTVALLFSLKQYDEAAITLENAIAANLLPPKRQHWELLASAWQLHREPARAIAALEKAIAQNPADPELRLHLARLWLHAENPKAAFAQTSAAVSLANAPAKAVKFAAPADAWFLHAYAAYESHNFRAAAEALDVAARQADAARLDASIRQLRQAVTAATTSANTSASGK